MKSSAVLLVGASFVLTGCLPPNAPSGGTACPYNTGPEAVSPENGLVASLYYLNASQPRYSEVEDYIQYGNEDPATLYFNQLNVPTRDYLQGFPTQNGSALTTSQGNPLYEYFALRFESQIRLAQGDQSGRYQFAVLSDDGAIMSINQSGQSGQSGQQGQGLQEFINNDGITDSRLRCANQGINFDATTSLPIQIDYFQGPRYNLSLMLLWREVPETSCSSGRDGDQDSDQNLYDVACDQAGNDAFFDWQNNPATPTPLWLGMLNRGWKVVGPDNFFLPTPTQPCASPSPSPSPSPSGSVSCSSGTGESSSQGVLATLKSYPGADSWGNELNVGCFNEVPSITNKIYFSDIDVPAQNASEGFPGPNGPLKDSSGDVLTKNFSLTFTGEIKLAQNQESGFYQFATISDDGSVLSLDTGSGLAPSVNNDYRHGSILEGSSKTVYLDQSSLIPMQLQYFQGTNPEIALIVMMRKTSGPQCDSDPAFGMQSSNSADNSGGYQACPHASCVGDNGLNFFNCSRSPSAPEEPYTDLLSRGWVVLTPDNYQLPVAAIPNPCIGGAGPSPSPSPSRSASPSPSPSPSPTPSPSVTHSASPSPSPTVSASPSPSPSPTVSASPSLSPTPSPSPSVTSTPTPSPSPSVTSTPTPSPSPSVTSTPTPSPSPSVTSTPTPSPSPSVTSTPTPSPSPSVTSTPTPSPSPSQSSCTGPTCGGGSIGI
jgi:hypothetical protein